MLGEISVDLRVDVADDALGIDFEAGAEGRWLAAEDERGGDECF
jgi:hypothetical protein